MKKKKLFAAIVLTLFLLLTTGGIFLSTRLRFTDYTADVSPESAKELNNPYIGWYQIHAYNITDCASFDPSLILEEEPGPGLALLQFNLKYYADSSISNEGLSLLDQILYNWQSLNRQLIVRFLYDWDGNGTETEPDNMSRILEHISQTAQVINRYSDSIYILQGNFTGSWGEMHSSKYTGWEDMAALTQHLASVTDSSIFLSVRTPDQWRTITESSAPLSAGQAFDGSLAARLSLFNDGMLGSETDLGTYGSSGGTGTEENYDKRNRQAEISFQGELCAYVPNGGEVVIANSYNDFTSAIEDLAATHISYLNSAYDMNVLSKWEENIYQGAGAFQGMNGLDYISRHLGYRYVLRSSSCSLPLPWENNAALTLTLENTGFSNSYRPFSVSLTLKQLSGNKSYTLPVAADTRFWNPGTEISLEIPLNIHDYAVGEYQLFLNMTDPVSGFPVLLANEGSENESGCAVGLLTIDKFP